MVVLLCRRHHRAVHEEGFRVTRDAAGGVQFLRPDGRAADGGTAGARLARVGARADERPSGGGRDRDRRANGDTGLAGERLDLGWANQRAVAAKGRAAGGMSRTAGARQPWRPESGAPIVTALESRRRFIRHARLLRQRIGLRPGMNRLLTLRLRPFAYAEV